MQLKSLLLSAGLSLGLLSPAFAQSTLSWNAYRYPATVQQIGPSGILVRAGNGATFPLSSNLPVEIAGQRIQLGGLVPGNHINIVIPAGQGQIVSWGQGNALVNGPYGQMSVPVSALQAPLWPAQNPFQQGRVVGTSGANQLVLVNNQLYSIPRSWGIPGAAGQVQWQGRRGENEDGDHDHHDNGKHKGWKKHKHDKHDREDDD